MCGLWCGRENFLAYVDQVLVPTLRGGDIVVLDSLALGLFTSDECANSIRHCGDRLLHETL